MVLLIEKVGNKEVRLEYTPFFDSILEDLKPNQRRKLNDDRKNYMFCVAVITDEEEEKEKSKGKGKGKGKKKKVGKTKDTRKLYKQGQYKQAEKYYHQRVKQVLGKDLKEFVSGKTRIRDGKVEDVRLG